MRKTFRGSFSFHLGSNPQQGRFDRESDFSTRRGKWLSADDLRLVVLYLLSERPRHGYDIIRAIETHTSGFYAPSPGMIYPILSRLETDELAVPKENGTKKIFELTQQGRSLLSKNSQTIVTIMEQIKTFGEKMAYFQNQLLQEEQANERWGGGFGRENLDLKTEFVKTRRELKAAIFEKIAASFEEKKRVLEVMKKAVAEIRQNHS